MGTIAARDCLRVLELTEQVAAALTLATVRAYSEFLDEDRPLEGDLRRTIELIRSRHWNLDA
jgi:histidine ammonia-lyase